MDSSNKNDFMKNADRFKGFADIYDNARPIMPYYPVSLAENYLGKKAATVIDLGCGTGLSSLIWQGHCDRLTGIEPSADMLKEAKPKENETLSFKQAYAHETGLGNEIADIVVCSQSFHWMEPSLTLKEVNRILKTGGVFMTVDCDWPPVMNWRVENAYCELMEKVREAEECYPDIKDTFTRWNKSEHLANMKNSGYFRYCREVLSLNTEQCDKPRIFNILLSQGGVQTILEKRPEYIQDSLERFKEVIENEIKQDKFDIEFCYRMRIGVK